MDCKPFLLPLVAFAFASWVVSLGGISSLQSGCSIDDNTGSAAGLVGVRGFSAGTMNIDCTTVYRYYWFIVAFEFILLSAAAAALVGGITCVAKSRATWVGLFAVAALLYIQTSDSFLTASQLDMYSDGSMKNRVRTMVAGSIMTAVANLFLVIVFGMEGADAASCAKTPDNAIPTGDNAA